MLDIVLLIQEERLFTSSIEQILMAWGQAYQVIILSYRSEYDLVNDEPERPDVTCGSNSGLMKKALWCKVLGCSTT